MKISCIIIEDEPLAREKLESFVSKISFLELKKSFADGMEAFQFLNNNTIDLIFLDIHLAGISGIKLIETLKIIPKIICTTAYEKYALKGFELNVSDYLLKPFSFERFSVAVNRVYAELNKDEDEKFILIKSDSLSGKIYLKEILFIEGFRDYRKMYTKNKIYLISTTFGELEEKLKHEKFCRIHKSYMINLNEVQSFTGDTVSVGDRKLPISRTYKSNFKHLFNQYTL